VSGRSALPKLLVLASTYPRWAGDHEPGFIHELSKRLSVAFDVTVLCPHAPGAATREHFDGVKVVRYRYAPSGLETLVNDGGIMTNLRCHPWMLALLPGFILSQALWLWKLGHRSRCDVIHAHWLIPQGFLAVSLRFLGRRLAPVLVTSHGADLFALHSPWFTGLKRFVLRRSDRVTVVSSAMRSTVAALGVDVSTVAVEPMGVDLSDRFRMDPSITPVPGRLLFVGRLVEKKGLRFLIDALPALRALRSDIHLEVVGFGPERPVIEARISELGLAGVVRFLGAIPQKDLPKVYQSASVFVAPFIEAASGDQEGLGLVVVEALACGLPVVMSDLPSTRELGTNVPGLHRVPPGQSMALADGILTCLNGATFCRESSNELFDRFDWSVRTASYSRHLASLLSPAIDGRSHGG
jgi:glycosyltransferase involved in cell wall biosynthesis